MGATPAPQPVPAPAWPCNTLGNHDTPRAWNRYGDGIHDSALARLLLALLLTLKGTPFLYNGEEIGMIDGEKLVLTIDKLTLAPLVVVIATIP